MSLKDILAAKAATPAAPKEEAEATQKASEERAAWNLHDKQSNALGHGQQNQATGMMSSADVLTAPLASPARPVTTAPLYAPEPFIVGDPNEDPNNIPPEPAAEPQKPGPAGSYRPLLFAVRLIQPSQYLHRTAILSDASMKCLSRLARLIIRKLLR